MYLCSRVFSVETQFADASNLDIVLELEGERIFAHHERVGLAERRGSQYGAVRVLCRVRRQTEGHHSCVHGREVA